MHERCWPRHWNCKDRCDALGRWPACLPASFLPSSGYHHRYWSPTLDGTNWHEKSGRLTHANTPAHLPSPDTAAKWIAMRHSTPASTSVLFKPLNPDDLYAVIATWRPPLQVTRLAEHRVVFLHERVAVTKPSYYGIACLNPSDLSLRARRKSGNVGPSSVKRALESETSALPTERLGLLK